MRHSLLLFTALTAPAHAELHEHAPTEIHSQAWLNTTMQISRPPRSDFFEQASCWLPNSSNGKNSPVEFDNCVAKAIYTQGLSRQNPAEVSHKQTLNWSVMNYPAISSGAWSFIPDIGYQFLIGKNAEAQSFDQATTAPSDKTLSSMPLATLTWFALGCMLGSLAMMRRHQEKLAIATH
jgi:hypothetical protein